MFSFLKKEVELTIRYLKYKYPGSMFSFSKKEGELTIRYLKYKYP